MSSVNRSPQPAKPDVLASDITSPLMYVDPSMHILAPPACPLSCISVALQLAGVAIATAGFVIATRWFNVPIKDVRYSHGKLGVATLALVYSQVRLRHIVSVFWKCGV